MVASAGPDLGCDVRGGHGSTPGDDLLAAADIVATRAIRIDAPASAIWPWLVQMGPGRAGAYTYDFIENLFGLEDGSTRLISRNRISMKGAAAGQRLGMLHRAWLSDHGGKMLRGIKERAERLAAEAP